MLRISIILLCLVASLVLACGQPSPTPTSPIPTAPPTSAPTVAPTPTATPTPTPTLAPTAIATPTTIPTTTPTPTATRTATPTPSPTPSPTPTPTATPIPVGLGSTAFGPGAAISDRYTCQGLDISLPLAWTDPPENTRSFALVMHDPDAPVAGGWDHWVAYNIPATIRALPENQPKTNPLPNGGIQGINSWGNIGYGGPCPPAGPAHRYQFTLYVVDVSLPLQAGATKAQLLQALSGHILDEALLQGTYQRQ